MCLFGIVITRNKIASARWAREDNPGQLVKELFGIQKMTGHYLDCLTFASNIHMSSHSTKEMLLAACTLRAARMMATPGVRSIAGLAYYGEHWAASIP